MVISNPGEIVKKPKMAKGMPQMMMQRMKMEVRKRGEKGDLFLESGPQTARYEIDIEVLSFLKGKSGGQEGHPDHQVPRGFFGPGGGKF